MYAMPAEAPGHTRLELLQHCSMSVFIPVMHVDDFQACIRQSNTVSTFNLLLISNGQT